MKHFLFEKGEWLGEGFISFSTSKEKIKFFVKWTIQQEKDSFVAKQIVELIGINDKVVNQFVITEISSNEFKIKLDNTSNNHLIGQGRYDPQKVAWEFTGNSDLEGFEIFQLEEDLTYSFKAEYYAMDEFRTIVHGNIWKKG